MFRFSIILLLAVTAPVQAHERVNDLIRAKVMNYSTPDPVSQCVHRKTPPDTHLVRQVILADRHARTLIALGANRRTRTLAKRFVAAIKESAPERFKRMAIAVEAYSTQLARAKIFCGRNQSLLNHLGRSLAKTIKDVQKVQGDVQDSHATSGIYLAAKLIREQN